MKLQKWGSLIVVFLSLVTILSAEENSIAFFSGTVEDARVKAKKENKLYFIEFYAKWCEPCKWMEENTFTHPALNQYVSKNYVPVKVDVENLDGFVWKQKYKVQYLPTIVVLNADGALLGKYEKSMGANDLLRALQNHKGSPVSAETEYLAKENLSPAASVKTNQSNEAKPVFVTVKREPGLPKSSDVVKKVIDTKKVDESKKTELVPASQAKSKSPLVKKPEPVSDGAEYRVQVGVFSDALNASNEVSKLKKQFSQVVQVFNKKNIETNIVTYRVTVGKFDTREEANAFVQILKSKGISGVVKLGQELKS